MKGYARIILDGEAFGNRRNSTKRLAELEKNLQKAGIEFVEDYARDNIVVVRWGAYTDDALYEREVPAIEELTEVAKYLPPK